MPEKEVVLTGVEKPEMGTPVTLLGTGKRLHWYWLGGKMHIRLAGLTAREIAALKSVWVFRIGN